MSESVPSYLADFFVYSVRQYLSHFLKCNAICVGFFRRRYIINVFTRKAQVILLVSGVAAEK